MSDNSEIHELDAFLLNSLEEELPGFKIPNLKDDSSEWLIDKLGVIKDRRKRLEKYEKILVALLKIREVVTGTTGNRFQYIYSTSVTTRLNQEKAKELINTLDEEKRPAYFDTAEVGRVIIKAL